MNMMNIINYITKYCKQFLKIDTWRTYFIVIFVIPIFKSYTISFYKGLFQESINNAYILEIFSVLSILLGLMVGTLILWVYNDIYLWVKGYLIKKGILEEKKEKERKEYINSRNVMSVYLQDLDVWARKNNCYDKVPKALWEELRVAKKALKFSYGSYNNISLILLLERYIKLHSYMKINKKIFKLLGNNKSNKILLKYYKIKYFIIFWIRSFK